MEKTKNTFILFLVITIFMMLLMSAKLQKELKVTVVKCNSANLIELYVKKYADMGYELKHVIESEATIKNAYYATHQYENMYITTNSYILIFEK